MEQLVVSLQRQVDAIMQHSWRTSDQTSQRWAFWILAAVPVVVLIELHNLVNGLLDSKWRTSVRAWQRGCFWIMLVALAAGVVAIAVLAAAIWLPGR
jgi:hypothetical protein